MAFYCTNCGKELEEGQVCICKGSDGMAGKNTEASQAGGQQESGLSEPEQGNEDTAGQTAQAKGDASQSASGTQSSPQKATNKIDIGEAANQFMGYSKNMLKFAWEFLKKPATTIQQVANNKDWLMGVFFLGLQAILTSIVVLVLVKKGEDVFDGIAGGFGSLMGMMVFGFKVNYFEIFFKVLFMVVLQFFILAGIFFGLGRLLGKKGSVTSTIGVFGVASIPITISLLISILTIFAYPGATTAILLSGMILTLLLNYIGLKETFEINENVVFYLIPVSYLIYFILVFKGIVPYIFGSPYGGYGW